MTTKRQTCYRVGDGVYGSKSPPIESDYFGQKNVAINDEDQLFWFCGSFFERYFSIPKSIKKLTMVVSDRAPRDIDTYNNSYLLKNVDEDKETGPIWYLHDFYSSIFSPWGGEFDSWLCEYFPVADDAEGLLEEKSLYVWFEYEDPSAN